MLLATQNPMDLDYRALSNAGLWCIGRLQTDADRERVIEGLATSTGFGELATPTLATAKGRARSDRAYLADVVRKIPRGGSLARRA
ncbi:MAG: hypothetical protein U0353_18710 [Sandaracinus sp.]